MMNDTSPKFQLFHNFLRKMTFRHFCGGESVSGCTSTISRLSHQGIMTILDYSAEGEETEDNFELTTQEVMKTIVAASVNPAIACAVFKVTGIARMDLLEKVSSGNQLNEKEDAEYGKVKQRVEQLCHAAHENSVSILIDAEHSWIQPAIDQLAETMMAKYNRQKVVVYTTIQMYTKSGLDNLKESLFKANIGYYFLGVKLVRGAYMDKERARAIELQYSSPIHPSKEATDVAFNDALEFCVTHLGLISICVGTHNEKSCAALLTLVNEHKIDPGDDRIFVAQLCGMSDHISFSMAQAGVRVAKYVPYGPLPKVIPYLLRRVDENRAVEGEASRELTIRINEFKRRFGYKKSIKNNNHDNTTGKHLRRPVL